MYLKDLPKWNLMLQEFRNNADSLLASMKLLHRLADSTSKDMSPFMDPSQWHSVLSDLTSLASMSSHVMVLTKRHTSMSRKLIRGIQARSRSSGAQHPIVPEIEPTSPSWKPSSATVVLPTMLSTKHSAPSCDTTTAFYEPGSYSALGTAPIPPLATIFGGPLDQGSPQPPTVLRRTTRIDATSFQCPESPSGLTAIAQACTELSSSTTTTPTGPSTSS